MLIFHVRLSFLLPNLLLYRLCVLYFFLWFIPTWSRFEKCREQIIIKSKLCLKMLEVIGLSVGIQKIYIRAGSIHRLLMPCGNRQHSSFTVFVCLLPSNWHSPIARVVFQSKQSIWHGPTQHPTTQKFEINASSVIKCTRKSETLNESANNRMKQKRNDTFFRW